MLQERTKLSTRGQIVIPKTIRDQAGLQAGDELQVTFDGERIVLLPLAESGDYETAAAGRGRAVSYSSEEPANREHLHPSELWASRLRAFGKLARLQEQYSDVSAHDLYSASRRELEGRHTPDGKGQDTVR